MKLCDSCKHQAVCAAFDDYAYYQKGDPFEDTGDSCSKWEAK